MGVDLTFFAVVDFESFLEGLDDWVEEPDDAHRVAYVMRMAAEGMDLLDPPEPARRMYHPRLFSYVYMLVTKSPSTLTRQVDVGRRLSNLAATLDQQLGGVEGTAMLYGDSSFGSTGQIEDGARYTAPQRCVYFSMVLNGLDIRTISTEASQHPNTAGMPDAPYYEYALEVLRGFYGSVAEHGEGAIAIFA